MWSVFVIILTSLQLVIGSYYWRNYNGTIPSDAFRDKESDFAIAKIYSEKYAGFHPTGLRRSSGPVIKYEYEDIYDNIKVLCAEDTSRYYWKWMNAGELRSNTQNQRGLVEGGSDSSGYVYIARIFVKGHWYIGEVDGSACFFYGVSDCYHHITRNYWCEARDCMVLKYK